MTDATTATSDQLLVVVDAPGDPRDWDQLIGDVGRAMDLEPVLELLPAGEDAGLGAETLLGRAAAFPGPVLALPTHRAADAPAVAPGVRRSRNGRRCMSHVLIPSDASEDVTAGARILEARLRQGGVHASMLHVLTSQNQPRMWEGAGHYATVWLDELRRRHGAAPEGLQVVTGEAGREVRAYARTADLVVLLWHHDARPGHAAVIRSLLGRGVEVPDLLIPQSWMASFAPTHPFTALYTQRP